jgi:hypothetical protein
MKLIRSACKLQPHATEINVGDQIEQLDQIIQSTDGSDYFGKTFITDGMRVLLEKGMARLAGKSNDCQKWLVLRPEERWWLYSKTASEASLADQKDRGWR